MKHSQGKLTLARLGVIRGGEPKQYANGAIQEQIAMTTVAESGDQLENARRLVACWNAFEGIPTEKFEGKDVAEFIGSQAFLNGMSSADGSAYIGLNGKACQVLASAFAGQFIGAGAVNFLEVNMGHPEIGSFTVTMQKTSGLTPAQLKAQAEKERDEALAMNAELLAALEDIRDHTNADDPESYRCDDREGCFDTVFFVSSEAIAKAKGGAA